MDKKSSKYDSGDLNFIISIVGSSASGKSATAKGISKLVGIPMVDLDAQVSLREKDEVDRIFAEKGTEYFKQQMELEMLNLFDAMKSMILVVGASAIQYPHLRAIIKSRSDFVIGLYAEPPILYERIVQASNDKSHAAHPLTNFDETGTMAKKFLLFREPFVYLADCVVSTSDKRVDEVIEEVAEIIKDLHEVKRSKSG
jgi:shikimate kinase